MVEILDCLFNLRLRGIFQTANVLPGYKIQKGISRISLKKVNIRSRSWNSYTGPSKIGTFLHPATKSGQEKRRATFSQLSFYIVFSKLLLPFAIKAISSMYPIITKLCAIGLLMSKINITASNATLNSIVLRICIDIFLSLVIIIIFYYRILYCQLCHSDHLSKNIHYLSHIKD